MSEKSSEWGWSGAINFELRFVEMMWLCCLLTCWLLHLICAWCLGIARSVQGTVVGWPQAWDYTHWDICVPIQASMTNNWTPGVASSDALFATNSSFCLIKERVLFIDPWFSTYLAIPCPIAKPVEQPIKITPFCPATKGIFIFKKNAFNSIELIILYFLLYKDKERANIIQKTKNKKLPKAKKTENLAPTKEK